MPLGIAACLLALSVVALQPLWGVPWFGSHEGTAPVDRTVAIAHELRSGDFYPRWLSAGYHGKGVPFFNYYSPGFYLLAGIAYSAGLPLFGALKLAVVLCFAAGALGMFLWCRRWLGTWGGALAAVLYLFAPYHFVDLYVRGALAEFAALAILPYLFHGIDRAVERPFAWGGLGTTAVASAAVVVTHQLSALLILPFASAYAVWRCTASPRRARAIGAVSAATALGAALSAFYWLPALLERSALRDFTGAVTSEYFSYANHFVLPHQWFSGAWGFGVSVPGAGDGISFQLGVGTLVAVGGAVALAWTLPLPGRRFVLFGAVLAVAALWLTSKASSVYYQWITPYRFVQFPWRFLGPASLFLAAAGGGLAGATRFASRPLRRLPPIVALGAAVLAVWLSAEARTIREPLFDEPELAERDLGQLLLAGRFIGALTVADEYLPGSAPLASAHVPAAMAGPVARGAVLDAVRVTGKHLSFVSRTNGPSARIFIPWYQFPGWRVAIDERPAESGADANGYIAFSVPPGEHRIEVEFGTTAARLAGWALSAAAVIALVALGALEKWRQRAVGAG